MKVKFKVTEHNNSALKNGYRSFYDSDCTGYLWVKKTPMKSTCTCTVIKVTIIYVNNGKKQTYDIRMDSQGQRWHFSNCKKMWVYAYCYVNPLKKDLYRIRESDQYNFSYLGIYNTLIRIKIHLNLKVNEIFLEIMS